MAQISTTGFSLFPIGGVSLAFHLLVLLVYRVIRLVSKLSFISNIYRHYRTRFQPALSQSATP
jgi:hypothetical protein